MARGIQRLHHSEPVFKENLWVGFPNNVHRTEPGYGTPHRFQGFVMPNSDG